MKDEEYEVEANGKLITVFSAPNYCDQMGNKGALLRFDCDGEYTVKQFEAVAHPPVRAMAYAGGSGAAHVRLLNNTVGVRSRLERLSSGAPRATAAAAASGLGVSARGRVRTPHS